MAALRAIRNDEPATNASDSRVDMKLEVVSMPVSDADRAKDSGRYGRMSDDVLTLTGHVSLNVQESVRKNAATFRSPAKVAQV